MPAPDAAMSVMAKESSRLALTRIQLRGSSGEVVSTDSRHMLLQTGFSFPWSGDVLVHVSGVLGARRRCIWDRCPWLGPEVMSG